MLKYICVVKYIFPLFFLVSLLLLIFFFSLIDRRIALNAFRLSRREKKCLEADSKWLKVLSWTLICSEFCFISFFLILMRTFNKIYIYACYSLYLSISLDFYSIHNVVFDLTHFACWTKKKLWNSWCWIMLIRRNCGENITTIWSEDRLCVFLILHKNEIPFSFSNCDLMQAKTNRHKIIDLATLA